MIYVCDNNFATGYWTCSEKVVFFVFYM